MSKTKNKSQQKNLTEALFKKALGYDIEEVVEEYVADKEDENRLILSKKKVIQKKVPPDISAVKTLLQLMTKNKEKNFVNLTDEELEKEKIKLLKLLKEHEEKEKNGIRKTQ
jgi:hypothetical protein